MSSISATACIMVFGTASLQQYIFQSNRLKENIGASYLAKYWLDEGLVKAMRQAGWTVDGTVWDRYQKDPDIRLPGESEPEKDADIEVIYVGGGNAALLCKNRDIARKAVRAWSRKLIEKAPRLQVAVGYGDVKDSLAVAYRAALNDLARCEEALPFGAALHGLPIIRTCTTTGLPASVSGPALAPPAAPGTQEEREWISQSAACKREQAGTDREPGDAQKTLAKEFASALKEEQRFTIELDKLGGREGQSHIAIVHADGNGMGKLLNDMIDKKQGNDDFLHHLRAFSASVTNLSKHALEKTLHYLRDALPLESLHHPKDVFPFRPVVYGGDDLTFVCDGRLGLDLAAFYLKKFSSDTVKVKVYGEAKTVDACAGVAIVPTKFPFARAYGFAEELYSLAKARRRENGEETGSWLDFQIVQEGATRSISALRAAQYRSLEGGNRLDQRPYEVLKEPGNESQEWDTFVKILKEFQSRRWPRTRAKGLLQALAQGPDAAKRFVEGAQWRGVALPAVRGIDENAKTEGWTGGEDPNRTTPYFDPLEALDFYVEAKSGTSSATGTGDAEAEGEE